MKVECHRWRKLVIVDWKVREDDDDLILQIWMRKLRWFFKHLGFGLDLGGGGGGSGWQWWGGWWWGIIMMTLGHVSRSEGGEGRWF